MMSSLKILLLKIYLLSCFKEFIGRQRGDFNYEKLEFKGALKYSRIERYPDNLINNADGGLNQRISELKLKEFEFYADKINMDRYDYTIYFLFIIELFQFKVD